MNTRASRAVPIYIFSASSFFRAKWHKFCFLCAPLKSRHREKCFDLGTNRHRKKSLVRTVQTFPLATRSTRLPRARTFYNPPHVASLALLSFSVPSPRRPFSAPSLLHAAPSPRRPSLCLCPPLPYPLPSPHPCDSCSKENHSRSKEISERFVRKHPFKTVTCALQTARQSLRNPPQKQKKCSFSQIF